MPGSEIRAGAGLFALVFTAGFALGVLREMVLSPLLGASVARALELTVMICISWLAAVLVVRHHGPAGPRSWWRIGMLAFMLLAGAEFLLGLGLMRRSLAAIGRDLATPLGLASLLAQSLLIAMPRAAAART